MLMYMPVETRGSSPSKQALPSVTQCDLKYTDMVEALY